MTRRRLQLARGGAMLFTLALLFAALVAWLNQRGEEPLDERSPVAAATVRSAPAVERGAYLARAGNCAGCHTLPGGAAYAGGRGIETPFGTVYAPNLTPDRATGLGGWSAAQFWRALHNGRSADGRLLYPAFPYPNYTHVTRADADALYAYLQSLPPIAQPNRSHALRFPFDQPAALAVWRALYFRAAAPGAATEPTRPATAGAMAQATARPTAEATTERTTNPTHDPTPGAATEAATEAARSASPTAAWQRGAYLVEGLGHCNACHASRNALGATVGPLDLAGGLIPVQNWYAPSLRAADEAGVADWPIDAIVALLRDGVSARGIVLGPMREVVGGSTQYLSDADLRAMATYLRALPPTPPSPSRSGRSTGVEANVEAPDGPAAKLYAQHCAACHGERGEGAPGIYPALAGSRAVTLRTPVNLVHLVLEGGFAPSTVGNPRPFGMPPFATILSDTEVAQLLSYLRASWGNRAEAVSAVDVTTFRRAK